MATGPRARSAMTTEPGTGSGGRSTTTVVDGHDLDVFALVTPVDVFVFDAEIGEVNLVVEVGKVVRRRPFFDLVLVAIGPSVTAIALVQPLLVFALELVVENDALDAPAALLEAFGFAKIWV